MKSVWLLYLVLIISAVYSQDTIELEYDPCTFKMCAKEETCRIVVQRESLEMAIAICVAPSEKDNANTNECITYSDGTNILNCKTKEEWTDLVNSSCKSQGLLLRTTLVKNICHDTSVRRYLQADYMCCSITKASGVTPLVITSTPPAVTTELPTQDEIGTDTLPSLSTEEATKTLQKSDDDDDSSSNTVSFMPLLIGIAVCVILVVIITYLIYRKQKNVGKSNKSSSQQQTVIINPYCDDFKYTFKEFTTNGYTPAPNTF